MHRNSRWLLKFLGFHNRHSSSSSTSPVCCKPYFVTTPIFYVNGAPHIGHLQSCLYADAFARMHRLMGRDVIFSTGTDEHGLKIFQAAKSAGKDPGTFCGEISKQFKDLFDETDISFTRFVRTTDSSHAAAVQNFWERLKRNGYIFKGKYEGWYNVTEETFVPPSQIKEVKDSSGKVMVYSDGGQLLEKMSEENYVFPLTKFKDELLRWYCKDVIKPKIYEEQLRKWVHEGLYDLSVSRQRSRLPWGIPVPGDPSQTIYVWLDALVNYLTAGGYPNENLSWPATCHVIGKDILKFHCIYWPAFLMAVEMELPSSIFCHSHWTVDHEKMSKSKGNVVDPWTLINKYDSDGLRYFLLRASTASSDSNYSETKIFRLLNAELADTLGNLLSRCCAPAINKSQVFPAFSKTALDLIYDENVQDVIDTTSALLVTVPESYVEGDFFHGIEMIMDCLRKTNGFVQSQKPWKLAKEADSMSQSKVNIVLHISMEVLRISALLLQPVVPSIASNLLDKLGIRCNERSWQNLKCFPALKSDSFGFKEEERTLGMGSYLLYSRRKD